MFPFYSNMSTFHWTSKDQNLLWSCSKDVCGCRFLLYTAALSVGVFGAQTQFSFVVFQVKQLLRVEGSTTLPDMKKTLSSKQEAIFKLKKQQKNDRCVSSYSDDTEHSAWKDKAVVMAINENGEQCNHCFVLTVLWSAQHPHIPSHSQLEPGPPTQEHYRQTTNRLKCTTICLGNRHMALYEAQTYTQLKINKLTWVDINLSWQTVYM